MLNLPTCFGVRRWVYLVAVVGLQAACFDGGGKSDSGAVDLRGSEEEIGDSQTPSAASSVGGRRRLPDDVTTVTPLASVSWRRPKLSGGFFATNHHRRPGGKKKKSSDRVTCDYTTEGGDGGETRKNEQRTGDRYYSAVTNAMTTVAHDTTHSTADPVGPDGSAVFNAEDTCVTANHGRPCVCYMTDFLDSLSQRLVDDAAADDRAPAVQCATYKGVPAAFIVSSAADAAAADNVTAAAANVRASRLTVQNSGGDENEEITALVRKEVDFDWVVNYHLQASNDGRDLIP